MKKRIISLLLSAIMLFSLLPVTAMAGGGIAYIERSWNGSEVVSTAKTVTNYTTVTSSTTKFDNNKWYVVNSNVTVADSIKVSGSAHLILCDGYTLTAQKGVIVNGNGTNSLTIYGQSGDSGKLITTGSSSAPYGAGIGGGGGYGDNNYKSGTITIHGGTIQATGGNYTAGIGDVQGSGGGAVTIYGGTVNAIGHDLNGAGIGCDTVRIYGGTVNATGYAGGIRGNVTVNGGMVTAKSNGGTSNNGIGGSALTVDGGTVTATGYYNGAGIGSSAVIVNAGKVTATGGEDGPGISGSTLTVNGGTVTATGKNLGAGIVSSVSVNGGKITADGGDYATFEGIPAGISGTVSFGENFSGGVLAGASAGEAVYMTKADYCADHSANYVTMPVEMRKVAAIVETEEFYDSVQAAILAAQDGQTVKMLLDAGESLTIAQEKNITLDLNGKVLTGNGNGSVVVVNGMLTLADSAPAAMHDNESLPAGGVITGGTGSHVEDSVDGIGGGGVLVNEYGSFTMTGGTITGNSARYGGGVFVGERAGFTMTGGTITGNTVFESGEFGSDPAGGGVYFKAPCFSNFVTLGGTAKIIENSGSNLYLGEDSAVQIREYGDNAPAKGMSVGVTTADEPDEETPVTFAEYVEPTDAKYFFADNEAYAVAYDYDEEEHGDCLQLVVPEPHSGAYEAFMELSKDFSDYACKACRIPRGSSAIPYADFLQALDAITDCTKEYFTNSCTKNEDDFGKGTYHAYVGENEVRIRVNNDYNYYSVVFVPFHYYGYYDHLPELLEMPAEDLESLINTPVSEIPEADLWILEFVEGCEAARYAPDCTACKMVRDPKDVYNTWLIGKYNGGDKSKLVYVAPAGEANIENEEAFLAELAEVWDGETEYEAEVDDTSVTFTFTDGENETVLKVMVEAAHTTHDGVEFQPWVPADHDGTLLPTEAGSWYLTDDVTLTANWSAPEGTTNLCLNGKVLNLNRYRIDIPENATLNLFDCGEVEHEGNINSYHLWSLGEGEEGSTPKNIKGGIIYTPGDTTSFRVYGTFNMFGGTITGHDGSTGYYSLLFNNSLFDSNVKPLSYAGSFNMYGGAITGNVYASNMYWMNKNMNFGFINPEKFESFTVGKDAVIDGNYILGPETGGVYKVEAGNVIVSGSSLIKIGTGDYAPTSNMEIGVRTATAPTKMKPVVFTVNNAQDYINNFESNMPDMHIEVRNKNALYLCVADEAPYVPHECVDHKEKQNGQAATCTEDGWKDYYKCTTCETLYSDAAMTTEITDLAAWKIGDGKIEKTGHDWTYSANENVITATCRNNAAHTATLTLTKNAAENYYVYDGSAKTVDFATDKAAAWKAAVGSDAPSITYTAKDNSELTDGKAINAGNYTATVTVDTDKTATLDFTIAKATPTINTAPTASAITYGQTLADSELTGGAGSVEGTFAWTTSATSPAVSDSETTEYEATFTPSSEYEKNYTTATCTVKLTVNKANYTDVTKTASADLKATSGSTVEITLPTIPTGASYGTVSNNNTSYFAVGTITGSKVTVTSAKDWNKTSDGTAARTFTVTVVADGDHNNYDITVSITPVFHTHSFSYAADGVAITATCENTETDCDLDGRKITLTLTAENSIYGGNTYSRASHDDSTVGFASTTGATVGSIEYYKGTDKLDAAPTDAGSYTAKLTVSYGASQTVTAEKAFEINKASPTVDQFDYTAPESANLTYDGNSKTATVTFKDTSGKLSGMGNITVKYQKSGESTWSTDAPKNAGTYMVAIDVAEGNNYASVSDLTTDGWTFTIEKASVTVPGANTGTFNYTGEDQSYFTLTGNELYAVASGEGLSAATQKDAGSYAIKLSLKDANNYKWASGTGDPTYTFTIAKAALTATASSHTVAYGAAAPTYTVSYEGWLKGEETPTTAAALTSEYTTTSNVGIYDVTFSTEPVFANYTVTTKNGKVTVERARTAVEPTVADGLVYTGNPQNGYTNAGTHVTLGGTSSATNAAESYSFTATPDANYAWSDGSTEAKTYNWSIVKATAEITVDETPIVKTFGETLTLPEATSTFGEVVCDTDAADLVNVGSYTVTYTVAGTSNYDGDTKTVSVTINPLAVNEPSVTGTYTYAGKEQTATVTGKAAYMTETGAVKGTNAGDYTITYTLDGNHCWADGSDGTVSWSIGKADMVQGVNITAPAVPISELVYTGEALELLCAGLTIDEKDGASFGTFYYSVDGTDWSTNLPTAINAGEYNPVWYFVGDENHNNIGSAEEPISQLYPIEISRGDQAVAIVAMNGYTYGGTLPEPSISITPSESAAVTYYYSATNTTTGGTEWKNMTATTLDAGTYYMYAVIAATDNFGSQTTEAAAFTVAKAYVTAPASGVGYTVDYANETITPADGYEVSTTRDDNFATGKLSGETDIVFGTTYYVRKVEDTNHNTSAETPYTPARPVAPTESNFSATRETVENKKDGTFSGITAKMEYKKGDGNWTSGPAMLTGLSNETVKVRYKARTEAFKSEEYSYTFEASTARLTVSFGDDAESQQLAYGAKVDKPTDPEKTGYTFGGWYSDEELTQAWNFDADTVTDNKTLYPKWIENAVQKAVITGNVTESDVNVPDATVELYLGTIKVAATVTNENGNYSFDNVENGVYNIVVTTGEKTKTELVTVDSTGSFSVNVALPASAVNSIVEHAGFEVDEAKSEISKTVVGGLDAIAATQTPTAGQTITIKLKVEPKEDTGTAAQQEIKAEAGNGKKVEFIDMSLWQITTTDQGSESRGNIGGNNNTLLTIVVPFDFDGVDVSSVMILRKHGDDNAEKMTKNPATGQEGFTVDRQAGTVTIYAKQFSTYAVGYEKQTFSGGGGSASSYAITVEKAKNGTFIVDKKSASSGATVTITVTPDKGFTLETLTVLDKNGKEIEVKNLGENKYSFKMPSGKVTVSATFMEDNTMLNFFVDVKATDYFYDAVLWAAENGITKGTDDVHFSPNMGTTRAQVVTFLWRAAGCPEPTVDASKFVDVEADSYYAKAVAWAIEQVITKGTSDTTFSPNVVCTRAHIVTFLARFAGVKDEDTGNTHGFTDVKAADYFNNAVAWAKENKVTEGTSATTFSPNTDCTRAQVVTFLYRWMVK